MTLFVNDGVHIFNLDQRRKNKQKKPPKQRAGGFRTDKPDLKRQYIGRDAVGSVETVIFIQQVDL